MLAKRDTGHFKGTTPSTPNFSRESRRNPLPFHLHHLHSLDPLRIHLLPQNPNLLLHHAPEPIPIQILVLLPSHHLLLILHLPRNLQQARHKRLLDIREAKPLRDIRDRAHQFLRVLDVRVVREFGAPVRAVHLALLPVGVGEEVFAVEAGRALGDARVEEVEVVGGSDHEDALVQLEAIDLVEEVRPDAGDDEGVEVFEDEEAGGFSAGFVEDLFEGGLGAGPGGEGFYVEGWDRGGHVVERVHDCFDADGLAVAGRTVEDESALPGDFVFRVLLATGEEAGDVVLDGGFHVGVEDHVVPEGGLDRAVETLVLLPIALVVDPDLVV